jgi:hypothetical protein
MWHSFDNGATLGLKGSEDGETICDEEHALGARITLEQNAKIAPFAITSGIYGWMLHTRFFAKEDEAVAEYDKMKASLSKIVEQFSDPNFDGCRETEKAIEAFVETYP